LRGVRSSEQSGGKARTAPAAVWEQITAAVPNLAVRRSKRGARGEKV